MTAEIVALARRYGRYGDRRITALLRRGGWVVNAKRVERIWRREGLKVPQRQPKRVRLWLADGSCMRQRPERANHIWAHDFVEDRTHDGRTFRMPTVIAEFTRESLAIVVARRLSSDDVLVALTELFIERGPPEHIHSDRGPEFIAPVVKEWLGRLGVGRLNIEKASPWANGYNESVNAKLRDELLDREIFHPVAEARVLIERWRIHCNTERPRPPVHRPRWAHGRTVPVYPRHHQHHCYNDDRDDRSSNFGAAIVGGLVAGAVVGIIANGLQDDGRVDPR